MSLKKIFKESALKEIADSLVLTEKLTPRQKREADKQLAEHRSKRRAEMSPQEELRLELLKLRFRLDDYVSNEQYNHEFTFGYFLEQYLVLTKRKKKEFASDIQIHETQLSQILKNRREPNDSIMIRLELHSNNMIPAICWFKLLEKEKGQLIKTDNTLRERESRYVKHSLQLTL